MNRLFNCLFGIKFCFCGIDCFLLFIVGMLRLGTVEGVSFSQLGELRLQYLLGELFIFSVPLCLVLNTIGSK